MANQEHVERLKRGVAEWNAWREAYPDVRPDLGGVDLRYVNLSKANLIEAILILTDLSGANLSGANLSYSTLINTNLSNADLSDSSFVEAKLGYSILSGTSLIDANISHADLSNANLSSADLSSSILTEANLNKANFSHADLSHADLSGATFNGADLSHAILSHAILNNTDLFGTNLYEAHFHEAVLASTVFAWVDLCHVERLDTVRHRGPSIVDIKTVQLPVGETRTHFLRGVGFSDTFIDYYDSLFTNAIQYESCFISYAHQDEKFAQRLYKDLQDKGVRCWFAPHNLRPGSYYRRAITDAIYIHQKVLLLLSKHSIQSHWVADEVETVLAREGRERCELLFPLRLDDAVMQATSDWALHLRDKRHIGDFTNWQDEATYQRRFAELLRHLKMKGKE